jgi:hypothetical protein
MKTKHYIATMVILILLMCSSAFCGPISIDPLQNKDQVLEVIVYKLGYCASMADVYDYLKEAMEVWGQKDAKKIRHRVSIYLFTEKGDPEERSFFIIKYFLIK